MIPYDQYKVVAEAAEGTPARTLALAVFESNQPSVYSNRQQVFSLFDASERDDAEKALHQLRTHGITADLYGRWWGYSWQPLDGNR